MIHITFNLDGGEAFYKACNSLSDAFLSKGGTEAIIDEIQGTTDENFRQQGLFLDGRPWKPINEAYKAWKLRKGFSPLIGQKTGDMRNAYERGFDGKTAVFGYTVSYAADFDAIRPIFGFSKKYVEAYKEAFVFYLKLQAGLK